MRRRLLYSNLSNFVFTVDGSTGSKTLNFDSVINIDPANDQSISLVSLFNGANNAWTFSWGGGSKPSWITSMVGGVTNSSGGSGGATITFRLDSNGGSARTHTVRLLQTGSTNFIDVVINQSVAAVFVLTVDGVAPPSGFVRTMNNAGTMTSYPVVSTKNGVNTPWGYLPSSEQPSWITITPSGNNLQISGTSNTGLERSYNFTIMQPGNYNDFIFCKYISAKITQSAADTFVFTVDGSNTSTQLNPTIRTATNSLQNITISVVSSYGSTTSLGYNITNMTSGTETTIFPSWISFSFDAQNNAIANLTENTSSTVREVLVKFTQTSSGLSRYVRIIQNGWDHFKLILHNSNTLTVGLRGSGTAQFYWNGGTAPSNITLSGTTQNVTANSVISNNYMLDGNVPAPGAFTYISAASQGLDEARFNNSRFVTYIDLRNNQLSETELNYTFGSLNSIGGTKTIYISGNPGASTCNKSIATSKGWTVV